MKLVSINYTTVHYFKRSLTAKVALLMNLMIVAFIFLRFSLFFKIIYSTIFVPKTLSTVLTKHSADFSLVFHLIFLVE